jgi:hypothetical protein
MRKFRKYSASNLSRTYKRNISSAYTLQLIRASLADTTTILMCAVEPRWHLTSSDTSSTACYCARRKMCEVKTMLRSDTSDRTASHVAHSNNKQYSKSDRISWPCFVYVEMGTMAVLSNSLLFSGTTTMLARLTLWKTKNRKSYLCSPAVLHTPKHIRKYIVNQLQRC